MEFSKTLPNDKTDIDKGYYQLDCYLQQIEQLRAKQVSTQPPPPPRIDLENILKTFEHQDGLVAQCEDKDALYQITARDYAENVARVRCISERFGKGKILR